MKKISIEKTIHRTMLGAGKKLKEQASDIKILRQALIRICDERGLDYADCRKIAEDALRKTNVDCRPPSA